jgi:hypothetical protein
LTATSGGTTDDLAIYRGTGGALTRIAREGQPVPAGDGLLSFMFVPMLNNAGQSAFTATITRNALGTANDTAIYRGDGGTLKEIAREGNLVPGGNGKFGQLDSFGDTDFDLNDSGQVAFFANLTNTTGGTSDNSGIFFSDDTFGMLPVARKGDPFLGSTFIDLRIAPGLFGEELGGLNNVGQVAFYFQLADQREGIAVWNANVPEPGSLAVGVIVLIGTMRRRRRI